MLTSERDLDIDGFGIAQSGNHITANLRSVDAHRALAGALHGDAVGHAAEHARDLPHRHEAHRRAHGERRRSEDWR